jgi:hypothetical protein
MLHIDVNTSEELIHYLTKRKGKLDPDTYLITITEPDSQMIITKKKGVYSEQFTPTSCNTDNSRTLNQFIKDLLDLIQTEWDKDHYLIIHAYKEGIARGIAEFIFHEFPDQDINALYYNTFNVDGNWSEDANPIFKKLLATQEFFSIFGLDF